MAALVPEGPVPIIIFYENEHHYLKCERHTTMALVRDDWNRKIDASSSVAFFTKDQQYMPDDRTVAEALEHSGGWSLELRAILKSVFWLQVSGYEDTRASFEVAPHLTPAMVRREIRRTVGILTDEFRLSWDGAVLDQEQPFEAQNLIEGAQLTVDLSVTVKVRVVQLEGDREEQNTVTLTCFGSDTVGDLHRQLGLGEDSVLVATSPYRRVLRDTLRLCHVASDIMNLHLPIELTVEQKIALKFEPITLTDRRQELSIPMFSTPLEIHAMLSEIFEMATDFRLTVNGKELDNDKPLIDQHLDLDAVIQLDILRPCKIEDQWIDYREIRRDAEVYLYSTESPYGLFIRDLTNDQKLRYEGTDLTIFGNMLDVFGPISGVYRSVLLVDRDIERDLPLLSFDTVVRRLAWARTMLLDVIPMSWGLNPREILCSDRLVAPKNSLNQLNLTGDSLITLDPLKVFVSSDKKLHMRRFARGSTHGDVRSWMQQAKGRLLDVKVRDRLIPDVAMDKKLDLELYFLMSASQFQTKVTVSLDGKSYYCCFEPQQVSFSDILIDVGKQAEVPPRHLFSRKLFCSGCGRQLSKEEEAFQTVPANCCRVRSLQLSDRRVKDIGTQTLGTRRRDVGVEKKPYYENATVSALSIHENASTAHPLIPLQISVKTPDGKKEEKGVLVAGDSCGALIATSARQLATPIGDVTVFCQEMSYKRKGEMRRAMYYYDEAKGWIMCDSENGSHVHSDFLRVYFRFLAASSPLPTHPNLQPQISIETNSELLVVNPQRGLVAAPKTALWNSAFVLQIYGVRQGKQLFWEVSGRKFVNSAYGQLYLSQNKIPGGLPKRHVLLLLRDRDRAPHIAVPLKETLTLYKRAGMELRMKENRVRCSEPSQPYTQLWEAVVWDDKFCQKFTSAARKR